MFNLPIIFYFLLILLFLANCVVIVYHLQAYKLNEAFSNAMTFLFVTVSVVFLLINFFIAGKVPWDQFNFIF